MAAKGEMITQVPIERGTRETAYTISVVFEMR
jgi:hypothetical protein